MDTQIRSTPAVSDFSLLDPIVQSDPLPFYELLHEQCPVYQMPETGMFMVTRYEDVRSVLLDPATFSNVLDLSTAVNGESYQIYESILATKGWSHVPTLSWADPPRHARYRKLLDQVFNLGRVRQLKPHIEQTANHLIDQFIDQGECEFVSAFALPFPGIIIAEQLGLNRDNVGVFKRWADAIVLPGASALSEDELRATAEIELEMQHYLAATFEERRKTPTDDLISGLVHAECEDEQPLSMAELQSTMHQLIVAGYDTTISALSSGLWLLLRFPEQMAKLRADPSLLKGFVDEALRYEAPVQGLVRRATRDVEIAGTPIPAESLVIVRYGAANHDPAKYSCPHQFDIERKNAATHLSFGNGIHFCVGRLLAKQELESAFSILLARLSDITLAKPLPVPSHQPSLMAHALKELHIRFTKVA